MARSTKIIICCILLLGIGYIIFSTCFSAYNAPSKTVVSSKSIYKNVEETTDPDLLFQKSGDYVVYHESASFIVYVVIESFAFAAVASYLGFTKFCKENIADVFKSNSGNIIAFLCSSLSGMFIIEYILCYVVQTLIIGKFM